MMIFTIIIMFVRLQIGYSRSMTVNTFKHCQKIPFLCSFDRENHGTPPAQTASKRVSKALINQASLC